MIRLLLFLYLIFSTFSSWLAFSSWLRLPVVLVLILSLVYSPVLIRDFIKKPKDFIIGKEDYILFFFIIAVWIAFVFGFFKARSFNHSLSYLFSIVFYLIIPKYIITKLKINLNTIAKYVMISLIMVDVIIIIEWTLLNVFGIYIRDIFITGGPETTNMGYYWHPFFLSVGGTGEEPGGTASLINIYFPIGLWYLFNINSKKIIIILYLLLHFFALVFLASVAGIVFLLISYFVVSLYQLKEIKKYLILSLSVIPILFIVYHLNIFNSQEFLETYFSYIIEKVTLSNNNISANDRKFVWTSAVKDWSDSPIVGNGPGYGVETHGFGYFNIFLTLLADTGIFSLLLFVSWLIIILLKLHRLPSYDRFFLVISMGCLLLHSAIYYVYYHAPFWIPIILIQILYEIKIKNQDRTLLSNEMPTSN